MNHLIGCCIGILIIAQGQAQSSITSLPDGVVKVTKENNPKCVEYLSYKGETYCSTVPLEKETKQPDYSSEEKQKIQFDNRLWKAAWGKKTEAIITVEYVPVGDNINNWRELITSQYIPGLKNVAPQTYQEHFISNLKKSGATYTVNTLETQPDYVVFEFKVSAPSNLQQDELQKVTRGKDGLYLLHYAQNISDMTKEDRQKWLENLKKSSLKN